MIKRIGLAIAFFTILLSFHSCDKEELCAIDVTVSNPLEYCFLVAGHTYGDPFNWVDGLFPDFMLKFPFINAYPKIELGVFTGDIIPKDQDYRWDFALRDIGELNFPVHLAAGNHDLGYTIWYDRFGYYYKSFFQHEDLFIILMPGLDWNIVAKQLIFLKNTLQYDGPRARNIFIFHHELIWWSPDGDFSGVEINYSGHYPGETNFWNEVVPLFEILNKPCYFFAGDLGATPTATPFMYYKTGNIHLIANGMGARIGDNFIITEVFENGEINFNLCAIQGEINRLGDLEDYVLPDR